MPLNPRQQVALEVEMRELEKTLQQVKRLAQNPPESGLLTRYRPMPEMAQASIVPLVDEMTVEIASIVREFDLQPSVQDVRHSVNAAVSAAWAGPCDLLSAQLGRYGKVDPELEKTLDPHIDALIRLALGLVRPRRKVSNRVGGTT